jgi:hypothetical protein
VAVEALLEIALEHRPVAVRRAADLSEAGDVPEAAPDTGSLASPPRPALGVRGILLGVGNKAAITDFPMRRCRMDISSTKLGVTSVDGADGGYVTMIRKR